MAKKFERVEIVANDDETFTVEFYPVAKESDGKENEPMMSMHDNRKTMTAVSLESAIAKIQNMADGSSDKKASDMNGYLSGEMKGSKMMMEDEE